MARARKGSGARSGWTGRAGKAGLAISLLASGALPPGCGGQERDPYDREVRALEARIESAPSNAALAQKVHRRLSRIRQDPGRFVGEISQRLDAMGLVPLRVPGLFYRSHAWTGADLAGVEAWLGRQVALIETGEVDTVENNATCVSRGVVEATSSGRRAVLFSASKGGAEVETALASEPALASRVAAWIDLVGLLEGTPLTDPGIAEADRAALGLSQATALSISRSARAGKGALLPPRLIAIHVAGFPTADAITPPARAGFERLRALGPNDGFLLLDGFLRAPGRVLILPAADHYLHTPELGPTVVALVSVVLDELAGESEAAIQ
ncbi:MAG TPA: hypothetical protein DEP35_02185 [Deltaproteobacteria bacterium]|nr:hypothetical protein [Deltaproteobacteria bacterium]